MKIGSLIFPSAQVGGLASDPFSMVRGVFLLTSIQNYDHATKADPALHLYGCAEVPTPDGFHRSDHLKNAAEEFCESGFHRASCRGISADGEGAGVASVLDVYGSGSKV